MNPVLAQSIATLIGAIATAVLMAASYYWGPSKREERHVKRIEYRQNGGDRRMRDDRQYRGPYRRADDPQEEEES